MTNEEIIQNLQNRLAHLEDLYFRTNFIDKSVFSNPVYFNGKTYLNNDTFLKGKIAFFGATTPVSKQTAISQPTGGGSAGVDTPARTAINDIILKLQNLNLTA
jgi:hypothetical protein